MFAAMLSLLLVSAAASGQSLVAQGSAGPTITDAGHSVAVGIGVSATSRLSVLFGLEQTHLASRFTSDGRGSGSAFRGGTATLGTAELRATIFDRDRVSPYVLGGVGAGVSRPNVNAMFPNRVSNSARVLFFGGGIQVPLRDRLSVVADVRMVFGPEGTEGILAFAPVRAGVSFRF
jgi:hypothetical protein